MEKKRIELTKEQIEAIDMYVAGRITMFGASQRHRELLTDVGEAAEELMLSMVGQPGEMLAEEDLIEWYYDKYKKQQEEETAGKN